ncbi:MAG: TonB-dependent receptor [Bacteroidales bacterium]|nr:TonB-dependent receptor [Bacteroidales bacterium]
MRNKLLILLPVLLLMASGMASAQAVRGVVNDEAGQPVVGAYVLPVGNANKGTVTDIDGRFSLSVTAETLKVTCIGYKDAEVALGGREYIEVILKEDAEMLEETVVIGYGTVRKSDLTGAVSSVSSTVLSDRSSSNVGQLMQGRMAGVYIVDSGNPQSNVSIKIRGLGTVNNSDPLLVIDGVPMVNMGLNALNTNDIETIDVLKDASATAIYGARGANGVVIVTTKKGSSGDGILSLTTNQGVAMATNIPKLLDATGFAALNNDMMTASGNTPNPDWADPSVLGKGTDWLAEMISPAYLQKYGISYSGGDEKNRYYISGSYTDHDGIVRSVGFKKATFQANLDNQVKPWIKFSNNLTGSFDDKTNGDYSMSDLLKSIPALPMFKEDGVTYNGPTGNALWWGDKKNQVGTATINQNRTQGYNLMLSETVEISLPIKGLKFKSTESVGATFVVSESFRPEYPWAPNPQAKTERWAQSSRYMSYLADNYLTYDATFGKHTISAMAGNSLQWGDSWYMNGQKKGFLSDSASQFNNGTEIESLNGTRSDWAIASFMGRANWSYDNRYMLTATVRYDGSSKFGPGHRWGLFPSFAGAWRLSEEEWFPKNNTLSYLKLRAGYGVTGNQEIGDYSFASVYNTGQYSFNGNVVNSLVAYKLSNPDIHWEEMQQYNVGFDAAFFRSRLRLNVDAYIKNTNGMLVKMTVPISTGYDDQDVPYTNQGKVRNVGVEVVLSSDNIVREDFYWGSDFNITFNKNTILSLDTADAIYYNDSGFGQYFCTNMVGQPIGAFIGWQTRGLFQTRDDVDNWASQVGAEPGDIRFADTDNGVGNGVINDDDRVIIGYAQPKFIASLNNTLRYKDFDLSCFFQGVYGNKIFNVTKVDMTSMSTVCNQYASVEERWRGEGTSNSMPRAVYGDPNNNTRPSDRYIEDGSYLRLKSLTLGWSLPQKAVRSLGINGLRVYLEGTNLLTLTSYTGFDPEVGVSSIDWGTYPVTRTVSLGIDFKF